MVDFGGSDLKGSGDLSSGFLLPFPRRLQFDRICDLLKNLPNLGQSLRQSPVDDVVDSSTELPKSERVSVEKVERVYKVHVPVIVAVLKLPPMDVNDCRIRVDGAREGKRLGQKLRRRDERECCTIEADHGRDDGSAASGTLTCGVGVGAACKTRFPFNDKEGVLKVANNIRGTFNLLYSVDVILGLSENVSVWVDPEGEIGSGIGGELGITESLCEYCVIAGVWLGDTTFDEVAIAEAEEGRRGITRVWGCEKLFYERVGRSILFGGRHLVELSL